MIRRIRYISYLSVLNALLLSSDVILFDLDPIENNQILLNSYNTSILDTLSFGSIIFNQDHHLPYGAFLFNDLEEIQEPDTVSHLSQFVHKKGDFRYRDLVVSLAKINKDNVHYQFLAQNKSFTPLSIYGISGKGYLQNFLFDFTKELDDKYLSGTIAFHKENPSLPITYNFNSSNQGVFNTRESESILWGFALKRDIGKNFTFTLRNSGQYSTMRNNYNISEASFSDVSGSFNNNNFTIWNIMNSSYRVSSNMYVKMNLSSKTTSSFYENHSSDLMLDSLRYRADSYQSLAGLQFGPLFVGLDATTSTFNSNLLNANSTIIKPHVSAKILDYRDIEISINHRYRNFLGEIPYDSMNQNTAFTVPMLSVQSSEVSIDRKKGNLTARVSGAYISSGNYYLRDISYADYIYSNLYIAYLNRNLSISLSYKSYDEIDALNPGEYLPVLNKYFNYTASYEIPVSNKEYSIVLKANGRLCKIKNGAFNLNTLPMIKIDGVSGDDSVHYLDLSGSLKFKNFTISYHNITNSGSQFGLIDDLSDVGGAFSLPTYSILGREISIFHYLKVSWAFLD